MKLKIATLLCFTFAFAGMAFAESPAELSIRQAQENILQKPDHAPYYSSLAMAFARKARETSDVAYYDKAQQALDKAFAIAPDNFEARRVEVWLTLGRHEFAKALELATTLNKRAPDDVMIYGYMADANVELGNYQAALDAAQWMLKLRPGNVPGLTRGAYLRELHGKLTGATELMQMAYESTPFQETEDRAWLVTQLGHLALTEGNLTKADQFAQAALASFPDYHYALGLLAQVREAQGRNDEAVVLLEKRYHAAAHADNLYALAGALERTGRHAEAQTAYEEFERKALAESKFADNANHELIAYYVDVAHNPAAALRVAEQELARRHDVFTQDSYAWALAASGDYEKADAAIRKSLDVGVKDVGVTYHAGAIALHLGRTEEARQLLSDAAARHSEAAAKLLRGISSGAGPAAD